MIELNLTKRKEKKKKKKKKNRNENSNNKLSLLFLILSFYEVNYDEIISVCRFSDLLICIIFLLQ